MRGEGGEIKRSCDQLSLNLSLRQCDDHHHDDHGDDDYDDNPCDYDDHDPDHHHDDKTHLT